MVEASIALIGFMGTGKTAVSKVLSRRLNRELIDSDKAIEKDTGMTIAEIFKKDGEDVFRDMESQMIKELKDKKGAIISFGGGVCLREENIGNIKENHKVILLEASSKVIFERVGRDSSRPVLKGKLDLASIEKIMDKRKASYRRCADKTIDTDGKTISAIVNIIIKELDL